MIWFDCLQSESFEKLTFYCQSFKGQKSQNFFQIVNNEFNF